MLSVDDLIHIVLSPSKLVRLESQLSHFKDIVKSHKTGAKATALCQLKALRDTHIVGGMLLRPGKFNDQ